MTKRLFSVLLAAVLLVTLTALVVIWCMGLM